MSKRPKHYKRGLEVPRSTKYSRQHVQNQPTNNESSDESDTTSDSSQDSPENRQHLDKRIDSMDVFNPANRLEDNIEEGSSGVQRREVILSEDDTESAVTHPEIATAPEICCSTTWSNSKMENIKDIVNNFLLEDGEEGVASLRDINLQNMDYNWTEESEEDDSDMENEDDGANTNYHHLHNFLDKSDFAKAIDTPVNKNIGEVLMMIIKYALVNSLPLMAVENLFNLINCIFAKPILPSTKYFINKLFNPSHCTTYHSLCTNCGKYIGTFTSSETIKRCDICNIDINVKDVMYKDFFVTLDPSDEIANLLEENSDYYDKIMNSGVSGNKHLNNIYDGRLYRHFLKSLPAEDKNRYGTLVFNTDGAPLFESSTYSIWPIYIMLNELPIDVRTKNLIGVGLWFAKKKPDMNVFLKPFVERMNVLSQEGINCNINGEKRTIKIFCLVCCVDTIARAPMQGLTQFNGKCGCNWCKHPGEWVTNEKKPNSGSHKYPWKDLTGLLRTEEESIRFMSSGSEKKPSYGFKNPAQLITLNKFHIIDGFVPDSMHLVGGLVKQFATIWFGNKSSTSSLLTKSDIDEISSILEVTKAPHHVGRLTRSLADKEHWKAREWENFLLYYSAPIMSFFLDKRLIDHWIKLVEGIYILMQSKITIQDLNRADKLLEEFVQDTERLYSKVAMTFNNHLLLHLGRSVLNWGPLYEHSAFSFEAGNAKLLNVVHASKGVHQQICRSITLQSSYRIIKERVKPFVSLETAGFCKQLSDSRVQKTEKLSMARYFGKPSSVPSRWKEELRLSNMAGSFSKMTKDGCLYLASTKQNARSDNSFAKLEDGIYIQIMLFIVDRQSNVEFVVARKIKTEDAFKNKCKMLRRILSIDEIQVPMFTSQISTVCVQVKVKRDAYICALPNLCSY